MPSLFTTGLALFAAVSGVSANYYGTGTAGAPYVAPTYSAAYPYTNATAPYYAPKPTGYHTYGPDYYTTTVCEESTSYDSYGHSTVYTVPLYTTSCPYTTKTITYDTETYTTKVPVTTFYPPIQTYAAGPTGTGYVSPAYPTYATGAASSLKVGSLAAVALVMAAVAL